MSEDLSLYHYGVKGMRWGRRKSESSAKTPAKRSTPSNKPSPPRQSADRRRATKIGSKSMAEMSNDELQAITQRMRLEQTYSQMTAQKSTVSKGADAFSTTVKVMKTGADLYNLYNSPAGKAARTLGQQLLKKK